MGWLGLRPTNQKRRAVDLWDRWSRTAKRAGYTDLKGHLSADGRTVRLVASIPGDNEGDSK